ncbi:hypothetical protein GCM10007908_00890 [Rhizobium albus]|nr:hypothetical protein GCM10007908_00890 [Rhizobium albus]
MGFGQKVRAKARSGAIIATIWRSVSVSRGKRMGALVGAPVEIVGIIFMSLHSTPVAAPAWSLNG